MNVKSESFLFALLVSWGTVVLGQQQSDCIVERTQSEGICKAINECPSVLNDIKHNKQYTQCGFKGNIKTVCCPIVRQTTPAPEEGLSSNARISEKKCDEYKSAVYEYSYTSSLAVGSNPDEIRVDKCGHIATPLVVGGEFAKPREFPHMALILYKSSNGLAWGCGGTLISDEYVLTAGHCLHSKLGEPKYVRLGDLNIDLDTDDARPEEYEISEIIPHPQYSRASKYNDIALLRLNRKVQLDPYKRPACLPTTFEGPERKAIATGWGHTAWAGESSNHLQKVFLEKFSQDECNSSYVNEIGYKLNVGIVPDTQMCAGSKTVVKDTCQGDSGGPLQVFHHYQHCMYTVIGVTSFGITCGNIGIPGVYTRVYPYLDWIEDIVWGRNS